MSEWENEKLMAENATLRDEVKQRMDIVSKQLKYCNGRLIQLEAIETALNASLFDDSE